MSAFREVEGPLKAWLKAQSGIASLTNAGRHVYFAAPDINEKPTAWLTFRRIGGGPTPGEAPVDDALITFNCWGRTKAQADTLAEALVNALTAIDRPTPMGTTVVAHDAQITLWSFAPDPELPHTARVIVDAAILFRVVAVA